MEVVATVKSVSLSFYQRILCSYYSHEKFLTLVGALYITRKGLHFLCGCYKLIRVHIVPGLIGRTNLVKKYGKWAIVTGATDGLGKAYAEELASHGLNIILISRNIEKLQKVSEAITMTYGVKTSCVKVDFSQGREVYPTIKEAVRNIDVGILVNNVGVFYEYPQCFTETTEEKLWEYININIAAATMMVHIVLPGMLERKRGAIVNVSSGSCCKPTPQMAVYSATKCFMDRLAQVLHYEYGSKGIFIQSVVPFFVVTNLTSFSKTFLRQSILVPLAKDYVRQAVRTIGRSHRTSAYWSHSIQYTLVDCMPEWIAVKMLNSVCNVLRQDYFTQQKKQQQAKESNQEIQM